MDQPSVLLATLQCKEMIIVQIAMLSRMRKRLKKWRDSESGGGFMAGRGCCSANLGAMVVEDRILARNTVRHLTPPHPPCSINTLLC